MKIFAALISATLAALIVFAGCSRKNTAFMNEQAMKLQFERSTAVIDGIQAAEALHERAEAEQMRFEEHAESPPEDQTPGM